MAKNDKLRQEVSAERENIVQAFLFLEEAVERSEKGIIELSAIGSFVHNIYNGIENIFKRILKFGKITITDSPSSHKDLLDKVVATGIISQALSEELDEYRGFRHFFVHAYVFMLDEEQLLPLAQNLSSVWRRLDTEVTMWMANLSD